MCSAGAHLLFLAGFGHMSRRPVCRALLYAYSPEDLVQKDGEGITVSPRAHMLLNRQKAWGPYALAHGEEDGTDEKETKASLCVCLFPLGRGTDGLFSPSSVISLTQALQTPLERNKTKKGTPEKVSFTHLGSFIVYFISWMFLCRHSKRLWFIKNFLKCFWSMFVCFWSHFLKTYKPTFEALRFESDCEKIHFKKPLWRWRWLTLEMRTNIFAMTTEPSCQVLMFNQYLCHVLNSFFLWRLMLRLYVSSLIAAVWIWYFLSARCINLMLD